MLINHFLFFIIIATENPCHCGQSEAAIRNPLMNRWPSEPRCPRRRELQARA
jgi:hypothetical protein